ncbi:MAG: sulfatase-like hydrolase/transferase [Armatimonadia bacterium]|nr:sulfatase-like hydrolase/transferase [Armatimonadia bacterium]
MSESPERRPNIIWIFGDQHRAQALGCNGDPNVSTPNLDRLAAEGVNFTNAVAGSPLCCPFRGSLLTSLYPHECVPGHEYQMPPDSRTIAHAFNDAGYHTAYFGKWHLDGFKEREGRAAYHIIPPERRGGFQSWVGYENNNSQWDSWVHGGEDDGAFHHRLPGYETDCLTDLLIDYIRARGRDVEATIPSQAPFFAVLSVQPPHDPYTAPQEWMARHNPATVQLRPNVPDIPRVTHVARRELAGYYAQIENLDWNVGRVRRALADANLTDDTYIIFFSDHGDMHGSHGEFRKTSPWEESIRMPCIIGGGQPFYGRGRGECPAPINHVDIAPTSLGLCGLDTPEWMRGTDYSGRILPGRPEVTQPDSAYMGIVVPTGHGHSVDKTWRGVVTADGWKYAAFEGMPWLMFNLNEDPYELVNLAHDPAFHRKRRELNDMLREWAADTGDEFAAPTD